MNKISKLIGIMAFIAVIGFTMTACGELSEVPPKMVQFTITGVPDNVTLNTATFYKSASDALMGTGTPTPTPKTLTKNQLNGDYFCTVEADVYYIVVAETSTKRVYVTSGNPETLGFSEANKNAITAAKTAYDNASAANKEGTLKAYELAKAAVRIPSLSVKDINKVSFGNFPVTVF